MNRLHLTQQIAALYLLTWPRLEIITEGLLRTTYA
jgi:hypothetical protein